MGVQSLNGWGVLMDLFELNLLEVIHKHDTISQREISSEVGISLGMVNILIKKFIKTGLIKVEKITGNKVKYILTTEGFTYLSKRTIDYISRSYQAVLKIQTQMLETIEMHYEKDEIIFIYGLKDEIGELLVQMLKVHGYKYRWIEEVIGHDKYVQWQDAEEDGIFLLGY